MTPQIFALAIALARVCVSETGWDNHTECVVIVHALVNQAHERDIPLRYQICAYARQSCNRERTDARRWIAHLHPESRRPPEGWPAGTNWEIHRVKFASLVVTAYRAYIGELASVCPTAFHWGSRHCQACKHRMARGFVRAECGLSNAFWRRQGRIAQ